MKTKTIQFSKEELEKIDVADDLKISPFRADGKTYGTPTWIWSVVVEGEIYVRPYNGKSSRWYKSAIQQKAGRIHVAGLLIEVEFEPVGDKSLIKKIDQAYWAKYDKSQYLPPMLSERVKEATLRIIPEWVEEKDGMLTKR